MEELLDSSLNVKVHLNKDTLQTNGILVDDKEVIGNHHSSSGNILHPISKLPTTIQQFSEYTPMPIKKMKTLNNYTPVFLFTHAEFPNPTIDLPRVFDHPDTIHYPLTIEDLYFKVPKNCLFIDPLPYGGICKTSGRLDNTIIEVAKDLKYFMSLEDFTRSSDIIYDLYSRQAYSFLQRNLKVYPEGNYYYNLSIDFELPSSPERIEERLGGYWGVYTFNPMDRRKRLTSVDFVNEQIQKFKDKYSEEQTTLQSIVYAFKKHPKWKHKKIAFYIISCRTFPEYDFEFIPIQTRLTKLPVLNPLIKEHLTQMIERQPSPVFLSDGSPKSAKEIPSASAISPIDLDKLDKENLTEDQINKIKKYLKKQYKEMGKSSPIYVEENPFIPFQVERSPIATGYTEREFYQMQINLLQMIIINNSLIRNIMENGYKFIHPKIRKKRINYILGIGDPFFDIDAQNIYIMNNFIRDNKIFLEYYIKHYSQYQLDEEPKPTSPDDIQPTKRRRMIGRGKTRKRIRKHTRRAKRKKSRHTRKNKKTN